MRKKIAVTFLILIISFNGFSQEFYAWCPEEQIIFPKNGFLENQEIDLLIYDARIIATNNRISCNSKRITENLTELIKKTYTSPEIHILPNKNNHKKPEDNKITIRIAISAYQVAFGTDIKAEIKKKNKNLFWKIIPKDKWSALTSYSVDIYDFSGDKMIKTSKCIDKLISESNIKESITPKNILQISYNKANKELLNFIEDTFIQ